MAQIKSAFVIFATPIWLFVISLEIINRKLASFHLWANDRYRGIADDYEYKLGDSYNARMVMKKAKEQARLYEKAILNADFFNELAKMLRGK